MVNVRQIALNTLNEIFKNESYANLKLSKVLKENEALLEKRDRAFLTELVLGVLEKRIAIDYYIERYSKIKFNKISNLLKNILRLGIYQILFMDRVPASAACNESVKLAGKYIGKSVTGYVNALLRTVAASKNNLPLPDDKFEALSIKHSVPLWIIREWFDGYGEDTALKILTGFAEKTKNIIRINSLKTNFEKLSESLNENVILKKIDGIENAAEIEFTESLDDLQAFRDGYFHVQNLSSMLCCKALDVKEGQTVLDACSAPGGKAFTIAELMNNIGKITALDIYEHKIRLINEGARRLGIGIINTELADAGVYSSDTKYDRILCDVPCSGLGLLRKKPDISQKTKEEISGLTDIQYKILSNMSKLLKEDGLLVYSTCTLRKPENDEIINRFLYQNSDFVIVQIDDILPDCIDFLNESGKITILPGKYTEGFFITVLTRGR